MTSTLPAQPHPWPKIQSPSQNQNEHKLPDYPLQRRPFCALHVFHHQKWYIPLILQVSHIQSRSGVAVDPSCSAAFQDLKLSKKDKFIIFKLNDEKTSIVVSKQSSSPDYDDFLEVRHCTPPR
jgi:hypothetical protein